MRTSSHPNMPPPTETTVLSRYLLPPSSLPTVLPYITFLSLLPSNVRSTITNDPQSKNAQLVKRLYKDLQYQRDIDIDTVRQNIQRECARSEVLKARLRREIREELGENVNGSNVQIRKQADGNSKKRKRTVENDENEEDDEDSEQDQISDSEGSEDKEESTTLAEAHPITTISNKSRTATTNTSTSQPQPNAAYDPLHDPLETRIDILFSGPRGLAAPTNTLPSHQRYHTTTSLLQSMQQSVQDLEKEISDLDAQANTVLGGMKETVGGMSDLRYGKFARVSGGAEGMEDEGGLEEQVTQALRELKEVVKQKTMRSRKGREQT